MTKIIYKKTILVCAFTAALTLSSSIQSAPRQAPDVAAPRLGPDRKVDSRYLALHDSFLARGKQPLDLLFIGDSITEGWNYVPEIWNENFGKYNPANFGIAGDQTQHVLWRIEHGELDNIRPKVIVLMIGTNNIDRRPEEIARGVSKVVSEIHRRLPQTQILLLAIFPRGSDPKETSSLWMRPRIAQTNQILSHLNNTQNVHYLDIGAKFLDENGFIPKDLMPDGLHPTGPGYKVWAEAIRPLLTEIMKPRGDS